MNNYDQIDLLATKQRIAELASIQDAASYILNEEVPFNPLIIKRNINETKEILSLLKKDFTFSFDGIENLNHLFLQAKKNLTLTSMDCSKVLNFHNHCKRIKTTLTSIEGNFDIKDYSDSIFLNDDFAIEINRVVDNNGNIKPDASLKLKDILENIEINEQSLYDKAHQFIARHIESLQENTIYERNGRVSFLIKNSDKNKYNGYTYGTSASGLASYVEPEILINLNNRRVSLLEDKDTEINRLLIHITTLTSAFADDYINNFESLLKLNVIYAKARFGQLNGGVLGKIGEYLYLKDVCHPLINPKTVVCNTYSLQKPYQGIVISGTNTGGKTVGLKTIGLSVLQTYLGIPLICSEALIPLYNNVYVDIEDNQSISNSLSTFSAHISNINRILNNANRESLILIDELISGTDPKEAQAISLAILNKIEKLGSSFVITTHYDDIKNYAYKNDNILLSSVGFDNKELRPTYKYHENSVGTSNALDIAERYFDDKELIVHAREIAKQSSSKEEELMEILSKEISENQRLKDEVKKELERNEHLSRSLNEKITSFEIEKDKLKLRYEKELNNYIETIKEKAQEKLDSITNQKQETIIDEIERLKPIVKKKEAVHYQVGDNVKVGSNDAIGQISEINGKKVTVNLKGMSIKTEIKNLTLMPKTKHIEKKGESRTYKKVSKEINLVGMRVEEGLLMLEPYLDDALISGLSQVKIIHGIGTGQLRSAIREKLKHLKFVKSFSDGDYYDGGSAVTMVNLK